MAENPFELLGLPLRFDLSLGDIERRYREVQRVVHPDRHAGEGVGARRAALASAVSVSEAYRTLRDDVLRAEALLCVLGHPVDLATVKAPPELLLEMMDLRETLQDARLAGDRRRIEGLHSRVVAARDTTLAALTSAFVSRDLESVVILVSRVRYYQRFLDELAGFEDEDTHLGPL